jgi:kynurenine 3-monooxygenase
MSYLCTTRGYVLRKKLDNFLNMIFPKSWVPLYSMVTFSRTRYSEVVKKRQEQDEMIELATKLSLTTALIGGAAVLALNWNRLQKLF